MRRTSSTLLLLLLLAACRSSSIEDDINELVRSGRYAEAVDRASSLQDRRPDDERAAEIHRRTRVALLLDEARTVLFDGHADDALEILHDAWDLDPGNPSVFVWISKVRNQLAEEWLDRAHDTFSSGDLEEALAAYEEALHYEPENRSAKLGAGNCLLRLNYRDGQSRSYFVEGLRALRELYYDQAANGFEKSLKYDPDNDDALARKREVARAQIEERLAKAQQLEQDGFYFAARNEYRLVLLIEPDQAQGKEGFDRMDREVRARRALEEVDMDFRRGDFEGAEKSLERNEVLTADQEDDFARMRSQIEEAGLREMYDTARDLERDFRYDEAIEAYDALLEETEFYEDAIARRETLTEYITRAGGLYEQMLAADNELERLQFLREIDVFWPEYRDVPDRMDAYVRRANQLFTAAEKAETPAEAIEHLREIESFWPNYPKLQDRLAQLTAGE